MIFLWLRLESPIHAQKFHFFEFVPQNLAKQHSDPKRHVLVWNDVFWAHIDLGWMHCAHNLCVSGRNQKKKARKLTKKETLLWQTGYLPRPPCSQIKIKFCMCGIVLAGVLTFKFHQKWLGDFVSSGVKICPLLLLNLVHSSILSWLSDFMLIIDVN